LLQGENTPDIFNHADEVEEDTSQVSHEIGTKNEKLVHFEGFDEPLDGYFWLNYPSRQGFCVASNPGLYFYRHVNIVTSYVLVTLLWLLKNKLIRKQICYFKQRTNETVSSDWMLSTIKC